MSRTQLFKAKKFVMLYAAFALCVMGIMMYATGAKADTEVPSYIYATYEGESVMVDQKIDLTQLKVWAVYTDGTRVEVSDYYLATETVSKVGENKIAVVYLGKSAYFSVWGKSVTQIYPAYTGNPLSIGNAVDKRNVFVYAVYSDGSTELVTEFLLYSPTITKLGENTVFVAFGGKVSPVTVTGIIPQTVKALTVTYTGGDVMMGNAIDRNLIYVTASYEDGTTEPIINYEISTETPTMLGINTIVVSYDNRTATFNLNGIERSITSLTARYTGSSVEVGKEVRKSDILVTATYGDGTTEKVTDFDLPSPVIYFVGSHVKTVHYMGLTADIYVIGEEAKETSYDNAATFTVSNGIQKAVCSVALPSDIDAGMISGSSLSNSYVSRVVTRAVRKSRFITFQLEVDYDIEEELPLEMKITVPAGFDAEDCALYFTPNRTTIIAQMNSKVNDNGELITTIYKTGTYILSFEPE